VPSSWFFQPFELLDSVWDDIELRVPGVAAESPESRAILLRKLSMTQPGFPIILTGVAKPSRPFQRTAAEMRPPFLAKLHRLPDAYS
jgi:hypothetical protein